MTPSGTAGPGDRLVAWLLRGGLALATALLLAGVATKLGGGQTAAPVLAAGRQARSAADVLLAAGVLTLVATPLLRVVVLIGVWLRQRDWRFALVGVAVLGVLVVAALLGEG